MRYIEYIWQVPMAIFYAIFIHKPPGHYEATTSLRKQIADMRKSGYKYKSFDVDGVRVVLHEHGYVLYNTL